MFHNQC